MLSKLHTMITLGMDCLQVEVEVDVASGFPGFTIVGLADAAVQEARERVRSAIKHSGFKFPGIRITVNLAPADTKKAGPSFDLPLAVGILVSASEIYPENTLVEESIFFGELALDGRLRHTAGVLPVVAAAQKKGFKNIFVPKENAKEAALVEGISVFGAENLAEVAAHLQGLQEILPEECLDDEALFVQNPKDFPNFSSICGQEKAKRALEIAAAGSHNVLMNGSPGSGKTLMARAFPGILPRMTRNEAFEVSKIYSIAGLLPPSHPLVTSRPFRTVHHTASSVSIVGGGKIPRPGEISLSHRGVLFLDELAEFPPTVLEVLRQPLEDRKITVSRASGSFEFPAHFSLISAMNPCPCGYYKVPNAKKECTCNAMQIAKYQKRISGPLMDRIDLSVDISPVPFEKLNQKFAAESSETIAKRVQDAKDRQIHRFKTANRNISSNSEMTSEDVKKFCELSKEGENLMEMAMHQFTLSARAFHRILKTARSIADLAGEEKISVSHLAESLQYRVKTEE